MTSDRTDNLAWLFAEYRSTIDALPHPGDDLEGWRRGWAKATALSAELTRLSGLTTDPLPPHR
jgi:hypothetical protein